MHSQSLSAHSDPQRQSLGLPILISTVSIGLECMDQAVLVQEGGEYLSVVSPKRLAGLKCHDNLPCHKFDGTGEMA